METLRHVVLLVHLLGFAVLFGSWAVQAFAGKREFTRIMNWGVLIALVAGLALSAPWGYGDWTGTPNYMKIGIKLVILLVIAAIVGIGSARQRKNAPVSPVLFWLVGILTVVNAGLAVLW